MGVKKFVKIEKKLISLESCSIFDGIAYLIAVHYVFNVEYENSLKNLFGFFELLLEIPMTVRSQKALFLFNSLSC